MKRFISTSRLNPLRDLHLRPIKVVISHQSKILHLGESFALRCFQRLSLPNLATQQCPGRDNWQTRGLFIRILSYNGRAPSSIKRLRQIGTNLSYAYHHLLLSVWTILLSCIYRIIDV
ncbi:MAG: hypothetical protein CO160_01565 [Candidatus Portnoybacteria bacterium CG_4_9_14_3_um_filter_43_11]|uniref:Uncharacterized protein n=1 Tax=Candidatus Portnoybacteria bacterium CG_4_9_14_3_um_filter_43_11 TaxID=1974805 RepID=A0A2M7YLN4_9BACT|nr:MAG: hypothetical protein CO160_01565 [Candidatus Portnoybacteria bacterium CG_4_9_14_3_um_filter_43_11]